MCTNIFQQYIFITQIIVSFISPRNDGLSVCHDWRNHMEIGKYISTILDNFIIIHPSNILFLYFFFQIGNMINRKCEI